MVMAFIDSMGVPFSSDRQLIGTERDADRMREDSSIASGEKSRIRDRMALSKSFDRGSELVFRSQLNIPPSLWQTALAPQRGMRFL